MALPADFESTPPLTPSEIEGPSGAVEGPAPSPVPSFFGLSWWLSAGVIVADQISKALVRGLLAPFDSVTIIPGLLDFIHVQNAGVAFGILNDWAMNP